MKKWLNRAKINENSSIENHIDLEEAKMIMSWDIISEKLANTDQIYRDSNGTLALGNQMKYAIENLMKDKDLTVTEGQKYIDYVYEANRNYYTFQVPSSAPLQGDIQSEYIPPAQYGALNIDFNVLNKNSIEIPRPCKVPYWRLPSYESSEYRYVNDVITREEIMHWKSGARVFLSAGTGKGKNTFIKKTLLELLKNSHNIIIFENRESLLSQQIKELVKGISSDALGYHDVLD